MVNRRMDRNTAKLINGDNCDECNSYIRVNERMNGNSPPLACLVAVSPLRVFPQSHQLSHVIEPCSPYRRYACQLDLSLA